MSYRIYRFGYVALPTARLTGTFGSGPSVDHVSRVIGEAFDGYAWHQQNARVPYELTYSAWLHHWNVAVVKAQLEGWHAKRGKRDLLYRINEYTEAYDQWCHARLMQVRTPYQYQRKTMQPIDLVFQILSEWYALAEDLPSLYFDEGHTFDSGLQFDSGTPLTFAIDMIPKTLSVINRGNATTRYIAMTVTAGAAALTGVEISTYQDIDKAAGSITWAGSVLPGNDLIFDGRNRTVTNDGADAYTGFALSAAHANDYWFEFQPGANTISVTIYGGGAGTTLTLDYAHAWS